MSNIKEFGSLFKVGREKMKNLAYGVLFSSALQIFAFTTAAFGGENNHPFGPPVYTLPPSDIDMARQPNQVQPVQMNLNGMNYSCTPISQDEIDWSQLFPDLQSNP